MHEVNSTTFSYIKALTLLFMTCFGFGFFVVKTHSFKAINRYLKIKGSHKCIAFKIEIYFI